MPVQVVKLFDAIELGVTVTSLYSLSSMDTGTTLANGRIRFANTDSAQHTVTAYAVPYGSTPGSGNAFLFSVPVPGNSYLDTPIPELTAGGSVQALANVGGVIVVHCLAAMLFS